MKYITNLAFYFLSVVDGVVNLLASLFAMYPKMDSATSFLVYLELRRVNKEIDGREAKREKEKSEAEVQMSAAKGILDGED